MQRTAGPDPLHSAMSPAQIQTALTETTHVAERARAEERHGAIVLTVLFLLMLALVIRWVIRRNPGSNSSPAGMSDGVEHSIGDGPNSPLH